MEITRISKSFYRIWLCLAIGGVLTATSCKKSTIKPQSKGLKQETGTSSVAYKQASDSGEIYTESLNAVANHSDFPFEDKEAFYEELSQEIDDRRDGENQYNYTNVKAQYNAFIGGQFSSKSDFTDAETGHFFDKLRESIDFSEQGTYYLQQIEEAVTQYTSKAHLKDTLAFYQNELEADSLPTLEENLLERMMEIGQETGKYWEDVRQTSDHPWHDEFHEDLPDNQKAFTRNLISAGIAASGEVFYELRESGYSVEDASKTGLIQSAYIPGGPVVVDIGEL